MDIASIPSMDPISESLNIISSATCNSEYFIRETITLFGHKIATTVQHPPVHSTSLLSLPSENLCKLPQKRKQIQIIAEDQLLDEILLR
ncbi:hypothetical protein ZOSMA_21G00740 [Zostera marina]|uniref:Uncharacterized protein n=1 Tax=Zostera marina TaxID=29655 RepID=A0A0K9PLX1_ZOSMR|nr:hypothetical protein ZOSMA_21G00740 [Zostera marina]